MHVKRIGLVSAMRILGWLGLFYGLLVGLLYGNLFGGLGAALFLGGGGDPHDWLAYHGAMVGGWMLGCGLLMAVFGVLSALIGGLVLNLVLRITGGLELEIEFDQGVVPDSRVPAAAGYRQ